MTQTPPISAEKVEAAAIGLFQFDYPEDKWSRFGLKDYHTEKYRAKATAALTAAASIPASREVETEATGLRVDLDRFDGETHIDIHFPRKSPSKATPVGWVTVDHILNARAALGDTP